MVGVNEKPTPLAPGVILTADNCPSVDDEKAAMEMDPYCNYRSIIGALLYLAGACRPDIAFAVNSLARFTSNPGMEHWESLVHLLKYLKGTMTEGITFHGNRLQNQVLDAEAERQILSVRRGGIPNPQLISESYGNNLTAFADADFATDRDERRSTSGWVLYLNGGPISWRSHRQKSVSISTTEAELYSLSDATKEVIWVQRILGELGFAQPRVRAGTGIGNSGTCIGSNSGTTIFEDNAGCRDTVRQNGGVNGRAKHIDIRRNFLQSHVAVGTLCVAVCPTVHMVADVLTKNLGSQIFSRLFGRLMGSICETD